MAVPGCPELAFWTASIASPRITLMALVSSSFAMRAVPSVWYRPASLPAASSPPSSVATRRGAAATHSPAEVFRR